MLLSPGDLQILVRLDGGMTQSQIGNDLGLEQPAVSKAIRAAISAGTVVSCDGRLRAYCASGAGCLWQRERSNRRVAKPSGSFVMVGKVYLV